MSDVVSITLDEAISMIKDTDPANFVFWVGAGIDARYPTCLPLGDELRRKILYMAVGKKLSSSIDMEWENTYTKLSTLLADRVWLSKYQRLETIIDCIQDFENNLKIKDSSIINGLSCFSEIPPNHNHKVLASLLRNGSSIVTTNYEYCILEAFKQISNNIDTLELEFKDDNSSLYVFGSTLSGAGKLFYIHGIASEPDRIGISLSSIKKGLGSKFKNQYSEWINNGKTLFYLGYSGSDSLDVTPLMMECREGEKATAVFFKHVEKAEDTTSYKKIEAQANEKILLRACSKKIIVADNTSVFFNKLSSHLNIPVPDNEQVCKDTWFDLFQSKATTYNEKLYFTLVTRILFELNIYTKSIIKSSEFVLAENYSQVEDWFINYFCFRAAHLQGDKKNMRKYAERYVGIKLPYLLINRKTIAKLRDNSMALDYYSAVGFGINALILHKLPSKVKQTLVSNAEDKILPWAPTSQYNRFIIGMLIIISIFPFATSLVTRFTRHEIMKLIDAMTQIKNLGYGSVTSVNQINIGLRAIGLSKNLLNLECFEDNQSMIEESMQNYANTTHMHGLSTTLLFSSYSYCINYSRTKIESYRNSAIRDLELAARITQKTDDQTIVLRLRFAKRYVTRILHANPHFHINRSRVIFDND